MSEPQPPPPPTYSTKPIWAATIAYLLNLAVVLALRAFALATDPEADYLGSHQIGSLVGLAVGALAWAWTTRFRAAGLLAWSAPCLAVILIVMASTDSRSPTLGALAGFSAGFGFLTAFWFVVSYPTLGLPAPVRARLAVPRVVALAATVAAAAALWYGAGEPFGFAAGDCMLAALIASIALAIWAWVGLNRSATELLVESIFSWLYECRQRGPIPQRIPSVGPLLVVANHACWFDPVFVVKVMPRPATPMMTARFYSIWFMRPILKYVFQVIVVPETPIRREAPELKLAIAALDRGDCVMIFPEGYLRRKEEVPLRRFGQGIWQILKERPDTPVVACWIEGAWGAWCSYYNGLPTQNKRMDFRRTIRVGLSEAETVPAELLDDHLRTRVYLMNRVRALRGQMGFPELEQAELPTRQEAEPQE